MILSSTSKIRSITLYYNRDSARKSTLSSTSHRLKTTDSKPWFENGLKFKCTECGKCCSGTSGHVWISKNDVEAMSKKLGIEENQFLKKYARWVPRQNRWTLLEKQRGDNLDCIFLESDGKRCSMYDIRPIQCQTYPYWPNVLKSEQTWQEEKSSCEGLDNPDATPASADMILSKLGQHNEAVEKTYELGKKPLFDKKL